MFILLVSCVYYGRLVLNILTLCLFYDLNNLLLLRGLINRLSSCHIHRLSKSLTRFGSGDVLWLELLFFRVRNFVLLFLCLFLRHNLRHDIIKAFFPLSHVLVPVSVSLRTSHYESLLVDLHSIKLRFGLIQKRLRLWNFIYSDRDS